MRKLIMLALGLGAAELFRRHAAKTGNTPTGLIATAATNALASLTGAPPTKPKPLANGRDAS